MESFYQPLKRQCIGAKAGSLRGPPTGPVPGVAGGRTKTRGRRGTDIGGTSRPITHSAPTRPLWHATWNNGRHTKSPPFFLSSLLLFCL